MQNETDKRVYLQKLQQIDKIFKKSCKNDILK